MRNKQPRWLDSRGARRYVLQKVIEPSSLVSIRVVAGIGLLENVTGYLNWAASEIERQTCRSFARNTIRVAEAYVKGI